MRKAKLFSYLLLTVLSAIMVSNNLGCNTTEGAGKDIERGGEHLQDAADRNK